MSPEALLAEAEPVTRPALDDPHRYEPGIETLRAAFLAQAECERLKHWLASVFPKVLEGARNARGLSRSRLAKLLQCTPSYVHNVEAGRDVCSLRVAARAYEWIRSSPLPGKPAAPAPPAPQP